MTTNLVRRKHYTSTAIYSIRKLTLMHPWVMFQPFWFESSEITWWTWTCTWVAQWIRIWLSGKKAILTFPRETLNIHSRISKLSNVTLYWGTLSWLNGVTTSGTWSSLAAATSGEILASGLLSLCMEVSDETNGLWEGSGTLSDSLSPIIS